MDPATTLFTFMLQTHPTVRSVQLLGSWDNFSKNYKMERDPRRDRGQWKGCHTFSNIISDGDQAASHTRHGGLRMGQTYYYYYELDGSTETHDPSLPTTNACPYLPGQTVNTLEVPCEHQLRYRSASMNSLRITDYKTMDPDHKFITPRPAPPVPDHFESRLGSSPSLNSKRSTRSLSPAPRWQGAARRFFGLKTHSRELLERGRISVRRGSDSMSFDETRSIGARSITPPESVRSRDMSPESLRRFLKDDLPRSPLLPESPTKLVIPDDIVEECEDDDNFATSAVSETAPLTLLSPPPIPRSISIPTLRQSNNVSTDTILPRSLPKDSQKPFIFVDSKPSSSDVRLDIPRSHFSFSSTSSSMVSPASLQSIESRDLCQTSFFDASDASDDDDEEEEDGFNDEARPRRSVNNNRIMSFRELNAPFTGYSLPHAPTSSGKYLNVHDAPPTVLGSPALVARQENDMLVSNTSLLSRPGIDSGLDDLVSDMNWMADVIRPKDI